MRYNIHLNTQNHLNISFSQEAERPLSGEDLLRLIDGSEATEPREDFRYAFSWQQEKLLRAAASDEILLLIDCEMRTENEHRFDYFREEWTRLLFGSAEDWKLITIRNCEDDYNAWTDLSFRDARGESASQLETARADLRQVIRALPEIRSLQDLENLIRN